MTDDELMAAIAEMNAMDYELPDFDPATLPDFDASMMPDFDASILEGLDYVMPDFDVAALDRLMAQCERTNG